MFSISLITLAASFMMPYSMEREFLSHLAEFGQYAKDLMMTSVWTEADGDRAKVMLEYMLRSLSASADNNALIEAVYNTLPSELGDTMATFAEQLFKEGEIRGEIRGEIQGVQKTLDVMTYIEEGLDNLAIQEKTGLSFDIIESLRKKIVH